MLAPLIFFPTIDAFVGKTTKSPDKSSFSNAQKPPLFVDLKLTRAETVVDTLRFPLGALRPRELLLAWRLSRTLRGHSRAVS